MQRSKVKWGPPIAQQSRSGFLSRNYSRQSANRFPRAQTFYSGAAAFEDGAALPP